MALKYTYITVDFFCAFFPFLFSFHPKIKFFKQWGFFWLPCILTALFFLAWDVLFTELHVWSFNPKYILGFYCMNLPLEEVLFFLCIPYACVFTYYCMSTFLTFSFFKNKGVVFSRLLTGLLLIVGIAQLSKLYTSVTFILLSTWLGILTLKRVNYLEKFFFSFFLLLIPFFISNGILTGSFTSEPVVIYNNRYNLGIRMFSIPFEDIFYGMLLVLMNITGFEFLRVRQPGNK